MSKNYKYYVVTKLWDKTLDNGKIEVVANSYLLTKEEARAQGYSHGFYENTKSCDTYCDGYNSKKDALEAIQNIKDKNY